VPIVSGSSGSPSGILHQAETTLGWRIRREGQVLTSVDGVRTINARKFIQVLRGSFDGYRDSLKAAGWEDDIWKNLRRKMERVYRWPSWKRSDRDFEAELEQPVRRQVVAGPRNTSRSSRPRS
jgi:hypothetical protein